MDIECTMIKIFYIYSDQVEYIKCFFLNLTKKMTISRRIRRTRVRIEQKLHTVVREREKKTLAFVPQKIR